MQHFRQTSNVDVEVKDLVTITSIRTKPECRQAWQDHTKPAPNGIGRIYKHYIFMDKWTIRYERHTGIVMFPCDESVGAWDAEVEAAYAAL